VEYPLGKRFRSDQDESCAGSLRDFSDESEAGIVELFSIVYDEQQG